MRAATKVLRDRAEGPTRDPQTRRRVASAVRGRRGKMRGERRKIARQKFTH